MNDGPDECKWCGESGVCYKHCQKSIDGKHEHNPDHFVPSGEIDVIDVVCLHCGQSGSLPVLPDDIQW